MTTRSKGNKRENQALKELMAQGYEVDRARSDVRWIPTPRWHPLYGKARIVPISKKTDLFGVADLIAVQGEATRLIQITHGRSHASERRSKLAAKASRFPQSWSLEVWSWQPRKGWWKETYLREEKQWLTLERA